MQALRRLLLPFSFIYGIIVLVRNLLFDKGKLKSVKFPFPVIGIGNITTGGTGKTPHVEYLVRLLMHQYRIATLSRGYGRSTKGYILAKPPSNTHEIGDEPMQYLTKFQNIIVSVSENRLEAISNLHNIEYPPDVILMDDAFQHRSVIPGINIVLLEYDKIFIHDYFLPAGNLREPKSSIKRADIIIITKSPRLLFPIEKKRILDKLQPKIDQPVFFTYIKYGEFNKVYGQKSIMQMGAEYYLEKRFTILLVTGIANPEGMIEYLRRLTDKIEMLVFPDHHEFSLKDTKKIQETFDNIANPSKIIVTTEKDAMRLRNPDIDSAIQKLPFFYLPIEIEIHQEKEIFNQLIKEYVRKNQTDSKLYTTKN